jgi:hypothetical protein
MADGTVTTHQPQIAEITVSTLGSHSSIGCHPQSGPLGVGQAGGVAILVPPGTRAAPPQGGIEDGTRAAPTSQVASRLLSGDPST